MQKCKSFTLIELLIVLVIIGTLAILALPQYEALKEKTIAAEAIRIMGAVRDAQFLYKMQTNTYTIEWETLGIEFGSAFPGEGMKTKNWLMYIATSTRENPSGETEYFEFSIFAERIGPGFPEDWYSGIDASLVGDRMIFTWNDDTKTGSWYGTYPYVPKN